MDGTKVKSVMEKHSDLGEPLSTSSFPKVLDIGKAHMQYEKLLRKRRTYAAYFDGKMKSGGAIDLALKKVQCRRIFEIETVHAVVEHTEGYGRSPGSYRLISPAVIGLKVVGKPSLRECGRKEKGILMKYTARVRDRLLKRIAEEKKRVIARTQRAKQRELSIRGWVKAQEELMENFDLFKRYGPGLGKAPANNLDPVFKHSDSNEAAIQRHRERMRMLRTTLAPPGPLARPPLTKKEKAALAKARADRNRK